MLCEIHLCYKTGSSTCFFSNVGPLPTLPVAQKTVLQATTRPPDAFQIPGRAEASALLPILDSTDSYPTVCAGWVHPLCWHSLDGKSLVFLYLGHMPPYQVTSQDHWPPLTPSGQLSVRASDLGSALAWPFCFLLSEGSCVEGKLR